MYLTINVGMYIGKYCLFNKTVYIGLVTLVKTALEYILFNGWNANAP